MQVSRLSASSMETTIRRTLLAAVLAIILSPAGDCAGLRFVARDVSPAVFMSTHPGVGVHAAAINNHGQVLEQTVLGRGRGVPLVDSFLYSSGKVVDLDLAQPNVSSVLATGLNDTGDVAGQCIAGTTPYATGFLYSHNKLNAFPASTINPTGLLINNAGTLVATVGGPMAALYIHGAWQPLGTVSGQMDSTASSVNASGVVAGASGSHAAVWSKGAWTDLGCLPGQFASYAVGINIGGQVAGLTSGSDTKPFLWDKAHGMRALPLPAGLFLGAGCVAGINDMGMIAGTAYGVDGAHVIGWYNGQLYDVTASITNRTGMTITQVTGLNNHMEVTVDAVDGAGVTHPMVLEPVL